jgi:hypothetical protein
MLEFGRMVLLVGFLLGLAMVCAIGMLAAATAVLHWFGEPAKALRRENAHMRRPRLH